MADDTKNQGDYPDFEDDLEYLDLDDVDLEGDSLDDGSYDDITDEDLDSGAFADDEDWEEDFADEQAPARRGLFGKEKNLYTDTAERKGFSLSFNTMVIIGALMVGGSVLAYTVMSKSAQVAAAKPSVFRSMLNIGAVLDGGIFGHKEETPSQDQHATGVEDTGISPSVPAEQGFFDNPDQVLPDNTANIPVIGGEPPMPSPIAPQEDEADVLTPLPGEGGFIPRGPEVTATNEADQPARTAQDILEAAIANRGSKDKLDEATIKPVIADPIVEEAPITPVAPVVIEQPAPAPVAQDSTASKQEKEKTAAAEKRAIAAEGEAKALQEQLAMLQSRLQEMESKVSSVETGKAHESAALSTTVESLKQQLKAAQDKTAAETRARQLAEEKEAQANKDAAAKIDAAKKDAAEKIAKSEAKAASLANMPKATPAPVKTAAKTTAEPRKTTPVPSAPAATTASTQWELRAAQPGRAWVSKPGARDMQSVVVGENLSGIGRVTGISYINGRWIVQGTQGQVAQ